VYFCKFSITGWKVKTGFWTAKEKFGTYYSERAQMIKLMVFIGKFTLQQATKGLEGEQRYSSTH
jgi:hypothetical protein